MYTISDTQETGHEGEREDVRLIKLIQTGSNEEQVAAWEVLFDKYQPRLLNLLTQMVHGDRHLAEDIAQEAWLKFQASVREEGREKSTIGLLFTIARRRYIDEIRHLTRKGKVKHFSFEDFANSLSSEFDVEIWEKGQIAQNVAYSGLLSEYQSLLWIMWYVLGYSPQEIAELTYTERGNIDSLLNKARTKIKAYYEKTYPIDPKILPLQSQIFDSVHLYILEETLKNVLLNWGYNNGIDNFIKGNLRIIRGIMRINKSDEELLEIICPTMHSENEECEYNEDEDESEELIEIFDEEYHVNEENARNVFIACQIILERYYRITRHKVNEAILTIHEKYRDDWSIGVIAFFRLEWEYFFSECFSNKYMPVRIYKGRYKSLAEYITFSIQREINRELKILKDHQDIQDTYK